MTGACEPEMAWFWGMVGIVVLGVDIYCLGSLVASARQRKHPQIRYRSARAQVDEVLTGAKISMEEVAGIRRHGERRMSDSFGGWREWL